MTIDGLISEENMLLAEGPAISSRIRLARNIEQYSFPNWATKETKKEVWDLCIDAFTEMKETFVGVEMGTLSELDRDLLFEQHLISQELAGKDTGSGVFIAHNKTLTIMVNEEDHIRIQALHPGLDLKAAWKQADKLDDELEKRVTYAFSSKLGYLTSCPSNVGTGMRASVMLHLPGLVLMEEMEPVMNGISKIGLAVRGMWGEGTEAAGNMFQISNQITLGRSEKEIVEHLEQIVSELIEHEKNARERLLQDRTIIIKDQVARALGILSCARLITSSEALNFLSMLRLGYSLGVVKDFARNDLDKLFVAIQPAHLQKKRNKTMTSLDRDIFRADILRNFMDKNRLSEKNKLGIKNG